MDFLSRRPLASFALSFYVAASVFCDGNTVMRLVAAGILLAAFLCFGIILPQGSVRKGVVLLLAGCLFASAFSFWVMDLYIPKTEIPLGTESNITGTVIEVRNSGSYGGTYVVEGKFDSGEKRRILYSSTEGEFAVGDTVSDSVIFIEPEEKYRDYYLSNGIFGVCESVADSTPERLGEDKSLTGTLSRVRSALSSVFTSSMSRDAGGFAAALVLGDKSGISAETEKYFSTLGVAHLLSISGTHLAAVFSFAKNRVKGRRRHLTFALFSVAVLGYMILTGMSPSVVRAGVMLIFSQSAVLFRRRSDTVTVLGGTMLLICLADPTAIFDTGLQLSFAGVIGVNTASSVKNKLKDKGHKGLLWSALMVAVGSVTISAVTMPLNWLRFGEVSLLMPVTNLVMIPTVSVMLVAFLFLLVISPITPLLVPLAMVADKGITFVLNAVGFVARACDPMLNLGWISGAVLLIVILAIVFLSKGGGRKLATAVFCLFFAVSAVVSQSVVNDAHAGLTYCRVSEGKDDGICFFSEGSTVLIDCGQYSSAVLKAAEMGKNEGSGRIDALVLTRLYRRHSKTVLQLLEEYYVESLWIPAEVSFEDEPIAESLRQIAADMDCAVYTYLPGETLAVGNTKFKSPQFHKNTGTVDEVSFSVTLDSKTITYSSDGSLTGDVSFVGSRCGTATIGENSVISEKGAVTCVALEEGALVSDVVKVKVSRTGRVSLRDVTTSP